MVAASIIGCHILVLHAFMKRIRFSFLLFTKNSWVRSRFNTLLIGVGLAISQSNLAEAGMSFEVYGGYQTSPHSLVTGKYRTSDMNEELTPFKFTAGWEGRSFSFPPYYGVRLTNWNSKDGWGVDFTHSKAYADQLTLNKMGFELLQFTDGINNVTIHRQTQIDAFTEGYLPYYGYGVGIIVPHVEFQVDKALSRTFEYQYGGPTVALNSGIKVKIKKNRFMFAEYKFTAAWLNVNLNGGGNIKTRILTNALNFGLGFEF